MSRCSGESASRNNGGKDLNAESLKLGSLNLNETHRMPHRLRRDYRMGKSVPSLSRGPSGKGSPDPACRIVSGLFVMHRQRLDVSSPANRRWLKTQEDDPRKRRKKKPRDDDIPGRIPNRSSRTPLEAAAPSDH
jgi:hypothetical protein